MKARKKYRGSRLVKCLASFFFLGYLPLAPGTAGAAGGVGLYLLIREGFPGFLPEAGGKLGWVYAVFLVLFFLVGVYVSTRGEREWRQKDPSRIVIDEVFSIFITFLFLPITPLTLLIGFFFNRVFDIIKPFPIHLLEKAPGGWGVMLDDLMAGIYSNLALRVVVLLFAGILI
ncbi:MAG: phosphatidylglycerophosphatase A [Candidatus Auribacterota bacterium]|nr:phosphatidylglycerophosphatase A [Candidatus Auribacterota bacterium]